MTQYSHSKIGTYETCPLQYKYQYIDKIKTDRKDSVEAFMGSRVHETYEKHYKDLRNCKKNTLDELVEFYSKLWADKWTDDILIVKKEFTQENYRAIGEKAIREYYARFEPFEGINTIGCEVRISIALDDGSNIVGYIDRLDSNSDGVYEIHDYKTSSHLPTQEEAEADRQLALYSIAIRNDYQDCKDVKLIWHYMKFDKDVEVRKTPEQLEELLEGLKEKIQVIGAATEYPSNKSNLCNWCQFKEICPEWKDLFKGVASGSGLVAGEEGEQEGVFDKAKDKDGEEIDGRKVADRLGEIKKEIKILKSEQGKLEGLAGEYARANELTRIFGSDFVVAVKDVEKIGLPDKAKRDALVQALKDMGKWDEVSKTDIETNKLKKIIQEKHWDKDLLEILEKHISRSMGRRISISKRSD